MGTAVVIATLLLVPDLRPGRRHRLDLLGVALASAGLFCLVFGLIEGQRYDWGTVTGFLTIPEIIGAGVALLLVFLGTQALRQGREPLLPFAVFRDRNFAVMSLVLCAMGFAGVASGVLNTIQELGAVVASAAVGALLQNRLATALHEHAVTSARQVPAEFQDRFVAAFSGAARGGLEIGAGQTGSSLPVRPGVPAQVVQQLQQLAHSTFTHAFVDAMRPTLVLPIVVILAAALIAATARGGARSQPEPARHEEPISA